MARPVLLAGSGAIALAGLVLLAIRGGTVESAPAAASRSVPDFSGYWTRAGDNPSTFEPPPGGPGAIMTAVPHHGHCVQPDLEQTLGVEAQFPCSGDDNDLASNAWIADYTNPILQPWTRAALKKNADNEAKGISHLSFQQNCKPSGVPQILNLRYTVQLLQERDQVTILYENNQQVRRVYLGSPHPAGLSPSWYGHSVGHYEGDTLVVDTVAQNPATETDRFGTLHSDEIHVVERYRMLGPDRMQVIFTVDDPQAYTMPWRGVATYKRNEVDYFPEFICAENNRPTNLTQRFDVPTATRSDF
jgi:hypothetical protein